MKLKLVQRVIILWCSIKSRNQCNFIKKEINKNGKSQHRIFTKKIVECASNFLQNNTAKIDKMHKRKSSFKEQKGEKNSTKNMNRDRERKKWVRAAQWYLMISKIIFQTLKRFACALHWDESKKLARHHGTH